MNTLLEFLWPGRRALGRAGRWAAIGFIVGYAIGLLDLGGTDLAKFLLRNAAAVVALVALALAVAGTQRTTDRETFDRVQWTHVVLPDAQSPMAWA